MRHGMAAAGKSSDEAGGRRELSGRQVGLLAAGAAIEKKAEDLVLIDLAGRSGIADYFLLVTAANDRQVMAIADSVVGALKENRVRVLGVEGGDTSHWVLIDVGDVIVHVFQAEARAFYDLDGLWPEAGRVEIPDAPVSVRTGF